LKQIIRKGSGYLIVLLLIGVGIRATHAQAITSEDVSRGVIAAVGADDQVSLLQALPTKDQLNTKLSSGDTLLIAAAALGRKSLIQAHA
jgi:hypothetical protein